MLAALNVELDDAETAVAEESRKGLPERRRRPPDLPEARGIEAASVAELLPDHLVLPRGHLLEHVELTGHVLKAERGAP